MKAQKCDIKMWSKYKIWIHNQKDDWMCTYSLYILFVPIILQNAWWDVFLLDSNMSSSCSHVNLNMLEKKVLLCKLVTLFRFYVGVDWSEMFVESFTASEGTY